MPSGIVVVAFSLSFEDNDNSAVVLADIASKSSSSSSQLRAKSFTCILFWVSVPVLSVQITVTAPIVSDACNFLTRLLLLSIRRILRANDNVTAIGSPSGTAITIMVTLNIK